MISQFDDIIAEAIQTVGLVPRLSYQDTFALVNAVIQKESSFNPEVVSSAGAIGLMQINPNFWGYYVDLYDPLTNVIEGIKILQKYITAYGLNGGLAAYHAGPSQMSLQVAKNYASTVLSYFNSFRRKITSLFTVANAEYFTNSGSEFPQIDISNLSTLPPLDSSLPGSSFLDTEYYNPQSQPDYTWLYIAAAIVIILAVINR